MSVKSPEITSSHTGRTVAPPAYNRAHTSAIHRAPESPHLSYHLGKTRPKAASAHPSPGTESDLALSSTQPHRQLLAEIFSTSQPTISRTLNTVEKALEKVFRPLEQSLENSLKIPGSLVIDGTLIPTWNWRSLGKINFSGKHKRAGFNHQVICALDGKLLAITDPVPGARHDVYAFKYHDLQKYLDESTLADKGYIGLGLATPVRRSKAGRMPADVKVVNRFINSRRSVVERVIAQVKTWRVLHTGFRWPLSVYGRVFAVVRGLVFYAAGRAFE